MAPTRTKAPVRKSRRTRSPLEIIPGVGPSVAADLESLGIGRVEDLKRADPQKLYDRLCRQTGTRQDPCVLYTFRCAVYFASTARPSAERLNWWWWKDRKAT